MKFEVQLFTVAEATYIVDLQVPLAAARNTSEFASLQHPAMCSSQASIHQCLPLPKHLLTHWVDTMGQIAARVCAGTGAVPSV